MQVTTENANILVSSSLYYLLLYEMFAPVSSFAPLFLPVPSTSRRNSGHDQHAEPPSFCRLPTYHGHHQRALSGYTRPSTTTTVAAATAASYDEKESDGNNHDDGGIRLNKVLKETHSRREADALIESGRITVNGERLTSKGGRRVRPFVDTVELDGKVITGWETMNGLERKRPPGRPRQRRRGNENRDDDDDDQESSSSTPSNHDDGLVEENFASPHLEYVKYWKPKGVTCTTDPDVASNIVRAVRRSGLEPRHRIFPVGRLDKDTTGLILLTSDGRLPNAVLRSETGRPKTYRVRTNRPVRPDDAARLERGVVITTVAMRDGRKAPPLTARTRPCRVEPSPNGGDRREILITLTEGRNRQVRRMLNALDYEVVALHRVSFMGLRLKPLKRAGDWCPLDPEEMALVTEAMATAAAATKDTGANNE